MVFVESIVVSCAEGTPEHLFAALCNFPNLVQLDVNLKLPQTDAGPIATVTKPPNMPHLQSLRFNAMACPLAALDLVAAAPRVHILTLDDTTGASEDGVAILSKILQSQTIRNLHTGHQTWDFMTSGGQLESKWLPKLEKLGLTESVSGLHICKLLMQR